MSELGLEVFRRYGLRSLFVALSVGFLVWGLAHWTAAPGSQVSVLWGLVAYTKSGTDERAGGWIAEATSSRSTPVSHDIEAKSSQSFSIRNQMQVSAQDVSLVLERMRSVRHLRQLTASESGRKVTEIAAGTYFFFLGLGEIPLAQGNARRYPVGQYSFEFHNTTDDGLLLIAFLSEAEAAKIGDRDGEGTEPEVTLWPHPWGAVNTLVSIHVHKLHFLRQRKVEITDAEDMLVVDAVLKRNIAQLSKGN